MKLIKRIFSVRSACRRNRQEQPALMLFARARRTRNTSFEYALPIRLSLRRNRPRVLASDVTHRREERNACEERKKWKRSLRIERRFKLELPFFAVGE